ncbi:ergothioneine biosynthesis protein EgtB [Chryseosolibacter indicus]|uniref:Ergothioneine biosynthesis protein EgtB n=1 Tax=Chryseosolibacter indicus TaxID=2782351 RepID=A0ABS5VS10_9BACT|nr:ergothioneine biosynthesis protein EgtB [Chryseosolibacter indicus]MBT1703823.1 ergothioneine biosynthesis protein EgtB [Chryseosolibacter indicus]
MERHSDHRQHTLEHENISLKEKYLFIRKYSEEICKPLEQEDYVVQPTVDVSPPKWHLAHTTWFFEEFILCKYDKDYKRFNSKFSYLFNSYYNTVGDRVLRLDRGNMSRPTVEEIYQYRKYVDDHMLELLDYLPAEANYVLEVGFNHEQQHQELLFTDIKYILGHNPLFPPYKTGFVETLYPEINNTFAFIPEGEYTIGYSGYGFSYDNEHGVHRVLLKPYHIRKSLVTNQEYLDFINDGGYTRWEYWHSDGWEWVKQNNITAPLYWYSIEGKWYRYSLSGLETLNRDEPVTHISFYEASALAAWKGMRLPTEFEWEAAADQFNWGQRWEHTNSAYLPYPGYSKPDGALGEYNGKFMVNTMVLRGASVATPPNHSRKSYRNFFYPQLRWQFNGIRLCKDNQ